MDTIADRIPTVKGVLTSTGSMWSLYENALQVKGVLDGFLKLQLSDSPSGCWHEHNMRTANS